MPWSSVLVYIKTHKLNLLLLAVIAFLLLRQSGGITPLYRTSSNTSYDLAAGMGSVAMAPTMEKSFAPVPSDNYPPSLSPDRLVIENANLSLQVKDVRQTIGAITAKTQELGGFVVNSQVYVPGSAATGSLSLRLPGSKLREALDYFSGLSLKVVSEVITVQDVTDQYEDLDARLKILRATQAKFQSIQDQAVKISDLLEVQRELVSLQAQIDQIVGQKQYLEKSASLSLVHLELSTDEFSLPYSPDGAWRPEITFKLAVRSLVGNLRSLGNTAIWVLVYAPVWLLLLLAWVLFRRRRQHRLTN
jgi:hypothetical protein